MKTTYTEASRKEAQARVRILTKGWRTLYGVGNALYEPYAQINADYGVYYVWLKPQGDHTMGDCTAVYFDRD